MAITFEEHAKKQISEKGIIAWLEPAERILDWQLHAGSIYKSVVKHYVSSVEQEIVELEEKTSLVGIVSDGQWFFDSNTKTLYAWPVGSINPQDEFLVVFYKIGFSTFPFSGPINDAGREIEYFPTIKTAAKFTHQLDHEDQVGIALSSSSTISFILDDFFIENYDRLIWENKRVRIYAYSPDLPFSEKKIYFDGKIEDKSISGNKVALTIKDFLDTLNERVPLDNYSIDDGFDIDDSQIGKAKRRVYGRVSGLNVISLNKVLDGFEATGAFTGIIGSKTITGSGSNLLEELSPDDNVTLEGQEFKVVDVTSNTVFTVSEEIEEKINASQMTVRPEVQTIRTGRNNEFLITDGHAIKEASTTIQEIIQFNKYKVADSSDFIVGDQVLIGSERRTITQVSVNNNIKINQIINPPPIIGTTITRNPVQKIFANTDEYIIDRDYSITNNTNGSRLIFNNQAEFNVSRPGRVDVNFSFANGTRNVSVTGVNVKARFKPRDWIKPDSINHPTWYEILKIDEENDRLILRISFSESSIIGPILHKSIRPITDETIVTVECFGKTEDNTKNGVWIKNASQIVKDILNESGVINELDSDSFARASMFAPQLMSLAIPLSPSEESPKIKDVIELCNKSVFGSLHFTDDFKIQYNILDSKKPTDLPSKVIKDCDIKSWRVRSSGRNILKTVYINYRHEDADRFSGKKAASQVSNENQFVKNVIKTSKSGVFDFYLWDSDDAQIMAARKSLFNEISQSIITITTKLDLSLKNINEKVLIEFDRIYARFGSIGTMDKRKIGIISGISRTEDGAEITIDDLGNLWNRVANFTLNDAPSFSLSGDEKILNGYFTDQNCLIDDLQDTYKLNVFG